MKRFAALFLTAITLVAQAPAPRRPANKPKAAPPNAAPPKAVAEQWPIREFRVAGNSVYTPAQVVQASGLKIGDMATKENFERARDRILASGFFESFGWKYVPVEGGGGFIATLEISEPAVFLPWALDRVPVDREQFAARARKQMPLFGEKIPPSDLVLEKAAAVLQAMAAEKNVTGPMAGRVTLVGNVQMTILLGPKAAPPVIAEVKFTGSKILEPRYLAKALTQVAVGEPYSETNLRMFLDNQIKPLYEGVGRLRIAFPKVSTEPSKTAPGIAVTVDVDEGPAYKLGKIEVSGTPLSPEDIQQEGQFKTDQTVNFSDIGKGMNRIIDRLKAGGYMKPTYTAKRQISDEKKTVDLLVQMDPGPQYTFGRLEIKGLDLESEPIIRKMWVLKPGEPFKSTYPDIFLNQIRERGLFDNLGETKAQVTPDDKNFTVDVALIFKGAPPKPERKPDQF